MATCIVCNQIVYYLGPSGSSVKHEGEAFDIHKTCYDEYKKNPNKYIKEQKEQKEQNKEELTDEPKITKKNYQHSHLWKKSPPAIIKPPRPSLTSYIAKKTGESLKEKAIQSVVMAKNAAKTSKSIFKEADRRVGKIEDIETEEDAYEFAAKEVEEESYKKGLWAKAFSDAQGDEKKQAALYIRYRADQLIQFLDELA